MVKHIHIPQRKIAAKLDRDTFLGVRLTGDAA